MLLLAAEEDTKILTDEITDLLSLTLMAAAADPLTSALPTMDLLGSTRHAIVALVLVTAVILLVAARSTVEAAAVVEVTGNFFLRFLPSGIIPYSI
jgi:hypothetical protein